MAAIASAPPWNVEDDLLLKTAVEAGASLEALAKGAVRFSRKFSVQELHDRWHSLLFDNDVSAQAAARMTEFVLSNPTISFKASTFGVSKVHGKSSPAKRRVESIRGQYYEMRKRLCSFNTFDMSFIEEPHPPDGNVNVGDDELLDENYMVEDHVENYFEFADGGQNVADRGELSMGKEIVSASDCLLVDDQKSDPSPSGGGLVNDDSKCNIVDQSLLRSSDVLVDFQNFPSAEELGTSPVLQDMPLWKTMEDVSAPEMPIEVGLDVKCQNDEETLINNCDKGGDKISSPAYDVDHSRLVLREGQSHCEINRSISLLGDDFADISDSLLNFGNENEHLAMEVDGENLNDKSCNISEKSPRSGAPKEGNEGDAQNVIQGETSDSKGLLIVSEDVNNTEKNDNADPLHSGDGNQDVNPPEENTQSIEKLSDAHSPEFWYEPMECVLNTEDPEIPCNDDDVEFTKSCDPGLSLTNQKNTALESLSSKKEETPASSMASRMLGPRAVPITSPRLPLIGCGAKPEPFDLTSRQANLNDDSQCRLAVSPKFDANHVVKHEGIKVPVTSTTEHALVTGEPDATNTDHSKPKDDSSALYQDDSDEELDDDHHIPYFSDVENMILEMDLSPDDDESSFRRKVSRYHHEDAKRKIMRLEQYARSFTHRAIASRGAFAVFYGRRLKQYIKKTEVTLGRATEDSEVDIDLGEEGRANKISRRQAVIKLEGDGSFFLKNTGKSSIFVNGKEVATGHRMCLISSNLIEITGMSFVFETNSKSIGRYLGNTGKNGKEKYAKLEWSSPKEN